MTLPRGTPESIKILNDSFDEATQICAYLAGFGFTCWWKAEKGPNPPEMVRLRKVLETLVETAEKAGVDLGGVCDGTGLRWNVVPFVPPWEEKEREEQEKVRKDKKTERKEGRRK